MDLQRWPHRKKKENRIRHSMEFFSKEWETRGVKSCHTGALCLYTHTYMSICFCVKTCLHTVRNCQYIVHWLPYTRWFKHVFLCAYCTMLTCVHPGTSSVFCFFSFVPDHDGGRPREINAWFLYTHMVYL